MLRSETIMIDTYAPGQNITCTITSIPKTEAGKKTVLRLMRRDADIRRSLRHAQNHRRRTMHSYIRGGTTWFNRKPVGTIARVELGNSWTMPFTPDLANDLQSVSANIEIKSA